MRLPGFIGPAFTGRSVIAGVERCANLYPEYVEAQEGKNPWNLYSTPGRSLFTVLTDAPLRALVAGDNRLFAAAGRTAYEVFADGTFSNIGAIADDASHTPVQIYQNGTQAFLTATDQGYINTGSGYSPVTPATMGEFLDGFYIAQQPNSNQFTISALLDGTSWNALDFATKEGGADRLKALAVQRQILWLIGERTSETWYDAGNPDFPFQRQQGQGFYEAGTDARWTLAKVADGILFLGRDARGTRVLWRTKGLTLTRASNHALEQLWEFYPDIETPYGYTYQEQGHVFYVLTFPNAARTRVYDVTASDQAGAAIWHQRGIWNSGTNDYDREPISCHAYCAGATFGNQHFVGDSRNGNIYLQSVKIFSDAASSLGYIRRQRRAPHMTNEAQRLYYDSFQLDAQVGVPAAETSPLFSLSYSNDGGQTFNTPRSQSAGGAGSYSTRLKWYQNGSGRDRVFDVTTIAKMDICITDCYVGVRGGTGT